jgi:hypothetical protein
MSVQQTKPNQSILTMWSCTCAYCQNRSANKYDKLNHIIQSRSWHHVKRDHDDHENLTPPILKQAAVTKVRSRSRFYNARLRIPSTSLYQCHPQPPVAAVPTDTFPRAMAAVDTKLEQTLCWNPTDHGQSWILHAYGWLRERSCSCFE